MNPHLSGNDRPWHEMDPAIHITETSRAVRSGLGFAALVERFRAARGTQAPRPSRGSASRVNVGELNDAATVARAHGFGGVSPG